MTATYDNHEYVCNSPTDNRLQLRAINNVKLPYPLQEEYYVKIVVKDHNSILPNQLIAIFTARFRGVPSQSFRNFEHRELLMDREEQRVRNPRASLRVSVGIKCDLDLYGQLCATSCSPYETENYRCSDRGEKICKRGWKGRDCLDRDVCVDLECAQGAICVPILGDARCFCNGSIGPECYPNNNTCKSDTCKNGGMCNLNRSSSSDISCLCRAPFSGDRCQLTVDQCDYNPCENNGTCFHHENGSASCNCTIDFYGAICENKVDVNATTNMKIPAFSFKINEKMTFGIIFGVLFLLCLMLGGIYFFITWSRKNIDDDKVEPMTFTNISFESHIEKKLNGQVVHREETLYDCIDERAIYSSRMATNDDYLTPKVFSATVESMREQSENTSYTLMSSDCNLNNSLEILIECSKEEDHLPPLPMRNQTKNH